MAREQTFEVVIRMASGESYEDAFYGADYAQARHRADALIENQKGQGEAEIARIVFECEL